MVDVVLMELEGVVAETRALRRAALARALADEGIAPDAGTAIDDAAALGTAAARATLARAGRAGDETAVDLATLRAERWFAEAAGKGLALVEGARELIE